MPLDDLRDFLDQPTLVMPIGGREYTVQPCKADVWLRLQEIADKEQPVPDMDLFRLALGEDVLAEMLPNVTGPELRRAGTTAYLWQLGQEKLAVDFYSEGKDRKATGETPTPTQPETRTAAANTTRRRASGSGTSTRRKSKPAAKD